MAIAKLFINAEKERLLGAKSLLTEIKESDLFVDENYYSSIEPEIKLIHDILNEIIGQLESIEGYIFGLQKLDPDTVENIYNSITDIVDLCSNIVLPTKREINKSYHIVLIYRLLVRSKFLKDIISNFCPGRMFTNLSQ